MPNKERIVEQKRDNKVGDEWEISQRPGGPELTPSAGNSLAQVDRSSTYSDPDKDKQFRQKGSEGQAMERRDEISSEKILPSETPPGLQKEANKDWQGEKRTGSSQNAQMRTDDGFEQDVTEDKKLSEKGEQKRNSQY